MAALPSHHIYMEIQTRFLPDYQNGGLNIHFMLKSLSRRQRDNKLLRSMVM
jgi:hypothetical protein